MPTSIFFRLLAVASCLFIAGGNPVFSKLSQSAAKKPPAVKIIKEAEANEAPAKKKPSRAAQKKEQPAGSKVELKAAAKREGEDAEKKDNFTTHKVEAKPFKITAKLSGIVESKRQTPVAMDLDRWTEMTLVTALPHGTEVKEGDLLFQLETKDLEKRIRELKVGMPLKELDLETAEQELANLEQTTPLRLEQSRLAMEHAEEDLEYFKKVTLPIRERSAKEDLKSSRNYLLYAEEELKQLQKMYDEDDLTEETEEIILQRQKNSVASYKWTLEQTEARTDRTLATQLPREEESLQRNHTLKVIEYESSEKATKDALKRMKLDVEAKVREFDEMEIALKEYEADLAKMAPKAPHDGVVYYGMSQRGKWTTASTVERKMIPGGKLSMNEIAMTVVNPKEVQLRVAIPESKLKGLKKGLGGKLKLLWNPDVEFEGKLETVSWVPFADNTYDAIVSIVPRDNARAMPGMKGDIEIEIADKEKALTVPRSAVETKGKVSTVTMKNGEKRTVRTELSNGSLIEIVEGLKAGDEIRVGEAKKEEPADEKPEEKAPAKPGSKPEEKK